MSMKTLIDDIVTMFGSAITAGDIDAKKVYKGFHSLPDRVPVTAYPYICVDESGERVEDTGSDTAQRRYYSIIIEYACLIGKTEKALDGILDLSDQIKAELEKSANRKLDGHVWGISIVPFTAMGEDGQDFFRGRTITVEYYELEDRVFDY